LEQGALISVSFAKAEKGRRGGGRRKEGEMRSRNHLFCKRRFAREQFSDGAGKKKEEGGGGKSCTAERC